ncbi:MAG: hypothetical protein SGPRY_008025, partial [Prymnesium sp.]
ALESGVLMESFGNAKTVYNNNSSRFGKWCVIYFSASGKMSGCSMQTYLLEQSRIVAPSPAERNYHIFYHMLAGASEEERALYKLRPSHADYLYTSGESKSPGIDDEATWKRVKLQLDVLGFSLVQQRTLTTLLSAVLTLGNVSFSGEGEDTMCSIEPHALILAAEMLQVDGETLGRVMRTRVVRISNTESVTVLLRPDQCRDTRNAIAKTLYAAVFDHLVDRINTTLSEGEMEEGRYIGLLDVFGFENFENNSLEQLCINFTNERLQQLFMDCLVKREQAEYAREGIQTSQIVYPDNSAQIALIDGKVTGGSDENFVSRLHTAYDGKNPLYSRPKFGAAAVGADLGRAMDKLQFVIVHYAEAVQYTAYEWLEKNRPSPSP